MAEHVLETRILLRYGTYSLWMNSNIILKTGEAAVCTFPTARAIDGLSLTTPEHTPPAIGIKIGDGQHYFYELPWVLAVAADVYNWAKSSTKPSYTASEISGLASFIEENFHISGDVTIAPRIYQIVEGTDDDANKYFLRYKENNEEGEWVTDTNHPIDLTTYARIASWIGPIINNFPSMGTYSREHINSIITNQLNYTDTIRENLFVTGVSETAGVINVSRAQPSFTNISGTATVAQGGTGRSTLTQDAVLVGDGTNQVKLIPIAESVDNNNYIVPNRIIKSYVDNAVAGLAGAMHFIGEATVVIGLNSRIDPRIQDYNFASALPGDVVLSEAKEFVWTGSVWRLLGDETSYAVKGSIADADIIEDAGIQLSKIARLGETFNTKVDKVEGKTLTSNDFTDEYKQKLDGIADYADRNVIEHIFLNGTEVQPTTVEQLLKSVNLEISEFDDAAQQKLAGIEAGALINTVEKVIYDGTEITPDENKVITITSDPHTEHENKIETIFINGTEYTPNAAKEVRITIDLAALNLNVVEGAVIPKETGIGTDNVSLTNKKLEFERIAVTGNVKDLRQSSDTYIILNCGDSTTVI